MCLGVREIEIANNEQVHRGGRVGHFPWCRSPLRDTVLDSSVGLVGWRWRGHLPVVGVSKHNGGIGMTSTRQLSFDSLMGHANKGPPAYSRRSLWAEQTFLGVPPIFGDHACQRVPLCHDLGHPVNFD